MSGPAVPDEPDDVVYITTSGHAEFSQEVPLHSFTGESGYLHGMIDFHENLVDFYLDLNTLRTGIDRRDRDMFRTLNVTEYPFAEFTGSLETTFDHNSGDRQSVVVSGEFTIHGVTRELEVEGYLQKQGDSIKLEAEWILNLHDYDIEPPRILFVEVREDQEIRIEAVLEPQPRD